ncbi:MAG: outer membrane protein assembly factor BamA [bacterium]|nr:outer membrane protein assembly factor BamA [Candidatus Minthenecus merdequi]
MLNDLKILCLAIVLTVLGTVSKVVALEDEERFEVNYSENKEYVLGGINIIGAENYEDYVLIGFSGLTVGEKIKLPGKALTDVVKKFWKQGYFSDVKVYVNTIRNDSLWIDIKLDALPRVSAVNFYGLKKGQIEDLEPSLEIQKNRQLNADAIDRSKIAIHKYMADKGYANAKVVIYQKVNPDKEDDVMIDISVDKGAKVKVNDIVVAGNSALSIAKIDKTMKKTNRKGKIQNLFRTRKFVPKEYENDKKLLLEKYNELGYRDAKILSDTVVKRDDGSVDVFMDIYEGKKYYFGDVVWVGNTIYNSEFLNELLNVKRGSVYNRKAMNKRLFEDEDAVSALYKDNGYLFMQLDPVETGVEGDSINFEMRIYEGRQATINKITINGNDRLYEHVIRREMRVKPGALYSQSDLVRTMRELAQLGQFDEEKIYSGVDLKPDIETGTVDIEFNLESKQSDQVEFSAGVGQSGLVLSVGLKFTNFAIQNIFKPKTYRIVPQGEGQTLSLKVQLNGIYYQNYSISLYIPWIGGKRPNSLTMSLYYAVQTGLSNRAYTNYSNMSNYYQYYYGYYDQTYSYGSNSWGTEYDKNVYMRTLGVSVGFGTRLKWPDDYFQFFVEVSYQRHHLNNWFKYYYGFESGTTNDLALGLTLSRNSISNPIYTRRGSNLSLSVQATLPYSLFPSNRNKDYANMDLAEKNNWVEYHKWKFKAQFFTPLSNNEKLVLMTKIEYGFLGYYNPDKRSSFGKFLVGGDGTSGYTTPGSELVSLRGYDSGTLTPYSGEGYYGYNGNLYTKFSVELRYPLMLKPTSTIWVLGFLDAGNSWSEFKDFNPFELKRSAGAGVRVFLPMFGLLGVDWGWGFDKDQTGTLGGSHFHFILGQEF